MNLQFWSDSGPIKRMTMVVALGAALAGLVIQTSGAYKVAEPHLLTSRGFVREALETSEQKIRLDVQAGDSKTGRTLQDILRWQVKSELDKALDRRHMLSNAIKTNEAILARDRDMAVDARQIIDTQLNALRQQHADNEERITELRRELASK